MNVRSFASLTSVTKILQRKNTNKTCIKSVKIRISKFTYGRDTFIEKSDKEVIS